MTQNGSWTQSTLNPSMGLGTVSAGNSLTTTVTGSTIYIGLNGLETSNYTVDVMVDGQLASEYTPPFYYQGNYTTAVQWGYRIPVPGSALAATHTVSVICKTTGTTGCYVDWLGGNGFVSPNQLPLVWLGEPYLTDVSDKTYAGILPYIEGIRTLGDEFRSDGLAVMQADVWDNFNGEDDTVCLADQVHPASCGHEILATVFLSGMNVLFTKDQRIDFGVTATVNYSDAPIAVDVNATSGLPVSLKVLSGTATVSGSSIIATGIGTVSLEADQAGDANFFPAMPAAATIQIDPAPIALAVVPSKAQVNYPDATQVTVQAAWSGHGAIAGTVTLMDGTDTLDTAALEGNSAAAFSNLQLSPGIHELSATFAQQGNFAAAVSEPVEIDVLTGPAAILAVPSSPGTTVAMGQSAVFSLMLKPSLGFTPTVTFNCSGLPNLAACIFSPSSLALDSSGGTDTVTISTTGPRKDPPTVQAMRRHGGAATELAAALWVPGLMPWLWAGLTDEHANRKRGRTGRILRMVLLAAGALLACANLSGCTDIGPHTAPGTYNVTITATSAQGSVTVTQTATFKLTVTQ